jgi:hypothetical protein
MTEVEATSIQVAFETNRITATFNLKTLELSGAVAFQNRGPSLTITMR